ncbi:MULTISPECIES: radical SAM protein [unclassified Fusibacter]|uniref:radical SAM protein n=1 Tax=unclassified Fusibacter TaxID=2624464 RepID=UPI001011E1E1|nr:MULTISPECIES: radical SAM protein [unclassified Fusibacter]MCK8060749.1 radical SAM protein [Fusibacter sp. A2]NPE23045.1 radical SAM protein [Fusibacter sp. A1]RXV59717.1 radical SAM protein [Fusibacter sp. A1]
MECNIDILIAGCSTNCRHCYVEGGPERAMSTVDVEYILKRLQRLLPKLEDIGLEVEVTLDNEPINHPDALKVYEWANRYLGDYYFHHGSTTGIPIVNHADGKALLDRLLEYGYKEVSLTVHGGLINHNRVVQNVNGMQTLIKAAKLYAENGFRVGLSLMLGKYLIEDRDEVTELIKSIPHDYVYFAITNFTPTPRMMEYQKHRVTLEDVRKLKEYLHAWGCDEKALMERFEANNQHKFAQRLQKLNVWKDLDMGGERLYLSIDSALDLSIGNAGVRTKLLGNLRTLLDEDILRLLSDVGANDINWASYFEKESLPDFKDFVTTVSSKNEHNKIYPDMDSFLSYHLMSSGIKHKEYGRELCSSSSFL